MKHPLIIILLLFFCSSHAMAQDLGGGSVSIQFIDEQSKPIDGLFVQLMKTSDSSLVLSAFTDTKGSADFLNVKDGNYFIYVGQFQFETYRSSSINKKSNVPIQLGQVVLKAKALKEVTVTAQVPFIQKQPDMTIVNVDQSPMNSGGSTMDVLERSPGVIIDQNDNINLQGKSGVVIMIDGKKVAMSSSELADFLRGLPADAIDKIELITNPGAKYDAEGTAGIINIVLKKGKMMGLNGTVLGSYGQGVYPKITGGFNLNDREQKFNIYLNYNYSYRKNLKDVAMNQDFYNGSELLQSDQQHSYYIIPNYINTLHSGIDFFATNKTTLGVTVDGFIRKYQYNETSNSVMDSAGMSPSYSNSIASDNGTESQYALEFDYKHKYDSLGHKTLTGLVNYTSYNFNDVQNFVNNYSGMPSLYYQPPVLYGQIPFYTQIYTGQLDYSTMLINGIKIDAGIKGIYNSIDANTRFFLGTNAAAPTDTSQTQDYQYKQTILAAYVATSKNVNRGSVSIGLRGEQTNATGNLLTTGQQIKQNYLYFFPHITYTDTLDKNNNLELSAGTRFNRPDYGELDPFKNYINPTAYSEGNPELVPEYEYNIEASDVFKSIYVFTLSYALTQHPEETVHIPAPGEPGVTLITDENLQLKNYYGFSVSATPQINKWWASNNYASVFYVQYLADVSETPINNGKVIFQGNTDNIFTITKKLLFEVNGQYSSGAYSGYFQASQRWLTGAGIQTKLVHNKLLLKLNITDIFYSGYYNTTSSVYNYYESYLVKRDTRVAGISVTYKFGKSYGGDTDKLKKVDNMNDNSTKGL